MGMLMHHTWLEQQKHAAAKPVEPKEEPVKAEEESEPAKKTGGRRKASK